MNVGMHSLESVPAFDTATGDCPFDSVCAIKRLLEVVCWDVDFCAVESLCVVPLGLLEWAEKCWDIVRRSTLSEGRT